MKISDLTRFFMRRPTLFWSVMVGILLIGIFSFTQMPKLEDPAICAKQASVVVIYPGASAYEVELKVAQTLEDNVRTLPDVKEIKSECNNGMLMMTVEFKMTVLNEHLEQHFDQLRRKVNDCAGSLPQECYAPIVVDDMTDTYGLFYALKSDGYTYNEMEKYAKLIRRDLLAVDGVKRVNIVGGRREQINIVLNKEALARNGILPTQVMMQLQSAGKTVQSGKVELNGERIQLRVDDDIKDVEDIKNLLVSTSGGKQMHIGDIAKVERSYVEPQTNGFWVDGVPALAICIALEDNVIVPDVGEAVDAKLAKTMRLVPAGLTTEKIFFQPDKVNDAISGFMVNLIESVLIVIIALIFSMGFRGGFIIGIGLILTIALTFPLLLANGSTLQRISLGAFIIAMGMLVDNSIVVMDGILVDKKKNFGPKTYLYRVVNHTAMPLLGATVIAVSAFLSSYLSPDTAGEYCRDLFLVIFFSLMASWLLAIVQVPMCVKSWMPLREKNRNNEPEKETAIQKTVRKICSCFIEYKKITVSVAVGLLVLSMVGMGKVKNLFFPDFDYKQFVVEYYLPPQTSPDRVRHDLLEMTELLKKDSLIDRVAVSMGSAPAHYCLVRPMTNGGDCYGELMIDCQDFETVNKTIAKIKPMLREKYPDAYIRFKHYNFSVGSSHSLQAQFQGPDPAVLRNLSAQAEAIMRQSPYIDHYSVENNWKPKSKSLVAEYVQENALRAGINRGNVADALLAATDGLPIGVLYDQDKVVPIDLQIRNADGSKISDLQNIPVWSMMNINLSNDDINGLMTGAKNANDIQDKMFRSVPLSDATNGIKHKWEEEFMFRINGQRTILAQADPNTDLWAGTTAKALSDIKDAVEAIPLPDGYSLEWSGETKTQNEGTSNMFKTMPLVMGLVIGTLLLLFGSWKQIFLIVSSLPFVFCGITPALLLLRQPFTFMAIIGLMGLIGMMTKNAIVLIDNVNRLVKEERMDKFTAIVESTVSRARPVVMASLTTILGMIPLLGDPMYGSMAIVIMAGLGMGTIITLAFIPTMYALIYKVDAPKN